MSANWGNRIQLSIFGESHNKVVGINISGIPSGVTLDMEAIRDELDRRKPGSTFVSSRQEEDDYDILSGVLNGVTTGSPICVIFENKDQHSKDYAFMNELMRPGHCDYPAFIKYKGFNDTRGGGHFSARLTAPIVFAGAICKQILKEKKIEIISHIKKIHTIEDGTFPAEITDSMIRELRKQKYPLLHTKKWEEIEKKILETKQRKDSIGGSIECAIIGVPAGVGEPFFDSVESQLSKLLFSIPGVKGVLFGNAYDMMNHHGSEVNDCYYYDDDKSVKTKTNHNGGVLGGISTGMPIVFTTIFKPTASIGLPQETINIVSKENQILEIKGRHDPCIVLRAFSIVEAVSALVVLNMLEE